MIVFFFKQKTAYEMRISDWSSDVCSSDLDIVGGIADRISAAVATWTSSCGSRRRFRHCHGRERTTWRGRQVSLTNGESQRFTGDGVPNTVSSIPLTDVDARTPGEATIGALVKDATAQVSTLVRAEVELAKAEVPGEVKKGLQGSVFFILDFTVMLVSSFFFFFFLAEMLDTWVPRWLAFLIVFLIMVVTKIGRASCRERVCPYV